MNLILAEDEIPPDLKEFFEPVKAEFLSLLAVNTNKFKGEHYAPYPEHLVTPCILATCPPDGLVLDPFAGSGTTGCVALKNGRHFAGIELVAASASLARKRLEDISG
jgi:DNA modification methylase